MKKSILTIIFLLIFAQNVFAYTLGDIVEAIGKAENSKAFPYGIMIKFKHTTPKQACYNTVKRVFNKWKAEGAKGDFILYLSKVYAPIGAKNDKKNLNVFWAKNVKFFLKNK